MASQSLKMENSPLNLLSLNLKQIIIEEIALDGLDGVSLEMLIKYIEKRISRSLTKKFKARVWNIILNSNDIHLYKLPKARDSFELLDRFTIVDDVTGNFKSPDVFLDGPYEFCPSKSDKGSCKDYNTRMLIPKNNPEVATYEMVTKSYGNSLVLVASLNARCNALAPHKVTSQIASLTDTQYCMLELIGRARENGQVTVGACSNMTKIMKDPKTQFYTRKTLENLGLIKSVIVTQSYQGRGTTTILIRLVRFYKPKFLTAPKVGKLGFLLNYLRSKPDYREEYNVLLKKNLMEVKDNKKLKNQSYLKVVDVQVENPEDIATCSNKPRKKPRHIRYIRLNTDSDREDEDCEEGATERSIPCQYKIGVSLYRQAYERFLDAGMKGFNQYEMSMTLNIGYYAARRMFRIFKKENLIREVHEESRKNASPRYVAVEAIAHDTKYDDEKLKLIQYYENVNEITETPEHEIPAKRAKLDPELIDIESKIKEENAITELKSFSEPIPSLIEGFNKKKRPTLRQVQFANGILKFTREHVAITGFQGISHLIANHLKTNVMDRKPLKKLVQRLVLDGQVKVYHLKWPGQDRRAELICAPSVHINHPILKAKYREIFIRSLSSEKKTTNPTITKPLPEVTVKNAHALRRYMRVRKLHEFAFNFVYGEDRSPNNDLPYGFTSLLEMIPEMTVGLALGHLQRYQSNQIYEFKLTEKLLATKLKESPKNVFASLFASKKLQATLVSTMTILATFGLVQICNMTHKPVNIMHSNLIKYSFYINRNAKLVDTRGDWPRNDKATTITFHFDNYEEVEKYWNTLFEIATNTNVMERDDKKMAIPKAPVYTQDGAEKRDDARTVSDLRGAAGLHSAYYIESQSLWQQSLSKAVELPTTKAKLAKLKIQTIHHKKSKPKKTIVKKKMAIPIERRPKGTGKRYKPNLNWTEYDDEIILLCRAAVMIMSPEARPGCYAVRNTVARDLIDDPKKNVYFCHRRSTARRNQPAIDQIVAEFKKRKEYPKYHDLLTKLRRKFRFSMDKFMQEAKQPTMELVWLLYQLRRSVSFNKRTPCIATDYETLMEKYELTPLAPNKQYDLYKGGTTEPTIELQALKEAIMMTLFVTNHDNQIRIDTCLELYKYLETKSESLLKDAVAALRHSGAIVGVKKNLINQDFKLDSWHENLDPTSFASIKAFGISKMCQKRLTTRLNSEFADKVAEGLLGDVPHNVVGSPEMNCILFEAHAAGHVVITTQNIPVVVGEGKLTEETMNEIQDNAVKLRPGNVAITNMKNVKKLAELYKLPSYERIFDDIISESIVHPMNERYDKKKDSIVKYLCEKGEKGCSFAELETIWKDETASLIKKLEEMERKHVIKRVGFYENFIVLTEHTDQWSISFSENKIIPTPWLKEDLEVNSALFVKLCGTVLNKVFESPGKTIAQLAIDCDCIASRHIQTLCEFLARIDCVTMKTIVVSEQDLFSDDLETLLVDYNKFASHNNIAVFPARDAISKFSVHRNCIISYIYNKEVVLSNE